MITRPDDNSYFPHHIDPSTKGPFKEFQGTTLKLKQFVQPAYSVLKSTLINNISKSALETVAHAILSLYSGSWYTQMPFLVGNSFFVYDPDSFEESSLEKPEAHYNKYKVDVTGGLAIIDTPDGLRFIGRISNTRLLFEKPTSTETVYRAVILRYDAKHEDDNERVMTQDELSGQIEEKTQPHSFWHSGIIEIITGEAGSRVIPPPNSIPLAEITHEYDTTARQYGMPQVKDWRVLQPLHSPHMKCDHISASGVDTVYITADHVHATESLRFDGLLETQKLKARESIEAPNIKTNQCVVSDRTLSPTVITELIRLNNTSYTKQNIIQFAYLSVSRISGEYLELKTRVNGPVLLRLKSIAMEVSGVIITGYSYEVIEDPGVNIVDLSVIHNVYNSEVKNIHLCKLQNWNIQPEYAVGSLSDLHNIYGNKFTLGLYYTYK